MQKQTQKSRKHNPGGETVTIRRREGQSIAFGGRTAVRPHRRVPIPLASTKAKYSLVIGQPVVGLTDPRSPDQQKAFAGLFKRNIAATPTQSTHVQKNPIKP